MRQQSGWLPGEHMGSPGAWALHGNLVWASWGEGGLLGAQALTKVSRVGEQFYAECTLTGHCSHTALRQSVPGPGRPGPQPPWKAQCSC